MSKPSTLYLGTGRLLDDPRRGGAVQLPSSHLITHGVVVGMTGSGKTGLVTVMAEEALRAGIPTLIIDVKGDLPNLLLAFPTFDPALMEPWVDGMRAGDSADALDTPAMAAELAAARQRELSAWGIGESELVEFHATTEVRVITPGSTAGEPLHLLSCLERRSSRWDTDLESARSALSAAVSLVLRLLGREADPVRNREHVLLSVLAEARLMRGQAADLASLLDDVIEPPFDRIGAMEVEAFLSKRDRLALAAALNTLLAAPTFATWREGSTLDVGEWLTPKNGRTPAVVLSVAHLDDQERTLVLGVVLEELLAWVRTLPGSQRLRALVLFDEVYGFLPPHPANPPTKRPIVALMKQARAFGVGVVLATQNPMDLEYRALSNAGLWCIGRLQTDADRARVVDGLAEGRAHDKRGSTQLAATIKQLPPRAFLMRDAHADGTVLLTPRYAMSVLRGPMTRGELRAALGGRAERVHALRRAARS